MPSNLNLHFQRQISNLSQQIPVSISFFPPTTHRPISTLYNCRYTLNCRSQWPRDLRRRSAAARLLGLRVRIPPGAWMSVSCECYEVELSASGWSLVQRSPTECTVLECDRKAPHVGREHSKLRMKLQCICCITNTERTWVLPPIYLQSSNNVIRLPRFVTLLPPTPSAFCRTIGLTSCHLETCCYKVLKDTDILKSIH